MLDECVHPQVGAPPKPLCRSQAQKAHVPIDSIYLSQKMGYGFPGGPVVKNPSADSGEMCLIPGPRRFHMLRVNKTQGPQQEKPPQ